MTSQEISYNLLKKNSWDPLFKKAFSSLLTLNTTTFDEVKEAILALALCSFEDKIRKEAKNIIKKSKHPILNTALKGRARRNFQSATTRKKYLDQDILDLAAMDGFNAPMFGKALHLLCTKTYAGIQHFYTHATNAELKEHFKYDLVEDSGIIRYSTAVNASKKVIDCMLEVLPEIEEQVLTLNLVSDDNIDLDFSKLSFPTLKIARIIAPMEEFPKGLCDLSHLNSLTFISNLTTIPLGLSKLPNLKVLTLGAPIKALPDDFKALKLEELKLDDTLIESIPDYFGDFKELTSIFFRNNENLKTIPKSMLDLPNLPDAYKKDLSSEYFSQSQYEKVYNSLDYFIESFNTIPSVKATIEAFKNNQDESKIAELIVATSRCYYDTEHGLSSNNYYSEQIDTYAPETLKKVNALIKSPRFIDERTSDRTFKNIKKKLENIVNFDADVFLEFVKEMIVVVNKEYNFKKW